MVISILLSLIICLNSIFHYLRQAKEFFRRQKEYYFIYNHRLLYVVGLAFSRSLTNYAIINVLAWYFTYHGEDLARSSILSNIHDSLSSVLVIIMANAADSYVGRFYTLLFSNTAYIGGLMLFLLFNPYDVTWLVVIMLVLLALGTSAEQILQEVLEDLVNDFDKSKDKERSIARAEIWSRIAKVAGAICAILWVAPNGAVVWVHSSWGSSFLICMVTMTTCLIIFSKGHDSYYQGKLTERPVGVFLRVLHMHINKLLKRKSRRITNLSRLDGSLHNQGTTDIDGEGIMQKRSTLSVDTKGQEASGCSSYKQDDIVIVKSLLRMFPMWAMFLVVSLISATGSTFFLEQYNNLNTNNKIAVQIYDLIKDVSSFAIPFLYCRTFDLLKNEKVKIGVGMLCGIVSCLFAWILEVQRLKKVNNLDDKDANTSISFLWLVPQFFVLGCMEGLTRDGLLNFYCSQMKVEPLQSYGEEYIELVMGFGMFLNIILILILKSLLGWFGDTINDSRLDNYYLVLLFVGLANFIIYCLIARYYYKDAERHQDSVNDDLNQGLELLAWDNHEQDSQLLLNDDQEQDNQLLGNDDKERDNQLLASDGQKQVSQLLPNNDQEQDNQLSANDDQEQDNQLLPNDDQKQDSQLLPNDDQEHDNQLLVNSDHKQQNQLLANDDQKQDKQLLPNDDQKQDNQLLINDDHKQQNQLLTTDELQQDDQVEL